MEKLVSTLHIESSKIVKLLQYIDKKYVNNNNIKQIAASINHRQVENKEWLLDHVMRYSKLYQRIPKVAVLAGWFGLAGHMLTRVMTCDVTIVDKDPECRQIGRLLYPQLNHITSDLNDFDVSGFNILICTACEHITDDEINSILRKKDKSTVVFLQSNNYYEINEHINCKEDVNDFAKSLRLDALKKYTLALDKYERFMVIGK